MSWGDNVIGAVAGYGNQYSKRADIDKEHTKKTNKWNTELNKLDREKEGQGKEKCGSKEMKAKRKEKDGKYDKKRKKRQGRPAGKPAGTGTAKKVADKTGHKTGHETENPPENQRERGRLDTLLL